MPYTVNASPNGAGGSNGSTPAPARGRRGQKADTAGNPNTDPVPTRLDGTSVRLSSVNPADIPVTPIYLRSSTNGSGPRYCFRDTSGLDDSIEDLLRRFPQFRNKSTMIRSLVHFGLNVLHEFENAGLSPEALEEALNQEIGYVNSLVRIDEIISNYSNSVKTIRSMGDYRLAHRHLNSVIQLLNKSSLTTSLYAHYIDRLNDNKDVTELVDELEKRGFDMQFWNQGGR